MSPNRHVRFEWIKIHHASLAREEFSAFDKE